MSGDQKVLNDILARGPVIPVLTIHALDDAVPLARALAAGGLGVLEVTLRTEAALDAVKRIAQQVPEAIVGVGTVLNASDIDRAAAAGAKFAVSPGLTQELIDSSHTLPLLPGIATASELMRGLSAGFEYFKFFPAEPNGGVEALKSLSGPFPAAKFCPTGGVSPQNFTDYLRLPNVVCVGGSWVAPKALVEAGGWAAITRLAREACELSA